MAKIHTWSYSEDGKWWLHEKCGGIHECNPPRDKPPDTCLKCGEYYPLLYSEELLNTNHNYQYWADDGWIVELNDY